jgi:hypothetical protein
MKTTAEMIEVMQAFERGEKIQCRDVDEESWGDLICAPSWEWRLLDYRIKPREPRVIWVNEYPRDPIDAAHRTEQSARESATPGAARTAIKYVEAIE